MTTHVAEETSRVRKFQLSTNQEEQTKNHQAARILLHRPLDRCQGRTEEFLMEGRGPNFVSENITETFITEKNKFGYRMECPEPSQHLPSRYHIQ